jgi:hypothetical protein
MLFYLEEVFVMNIRKSLGRSLRRRFILFCLLLFSLFFATAGIVILTAQHTGSDDILNRKKELPLCTNNTSLYLSLAGMGEQPFGAGTEESKLALERKGLGIVFTLNPKSGSWSFLSTDKAQKTCFVAMGKKWHRIAEIQAQGMWKSGDIKKVGYSAPFKKMKDELFKEGKTEVGFGEQDIDLTETPLSKIVTHFFIDRFGLFTAVTSMIYKNESSSFEISSIDAVGISWTFDERYQNYPIN